MRPQYLTRAQLAKTPRVLRGPRADIWPENDYHAGATVVIDDPREPVIQPIGLLDAAGEELLKVTMPIKVAMGFALPPSEASADDGDEFVQIVPESLLMVSDVGLGKGYVTPAEVARLLAEDEDEDGDEDHDEADDTDTVTVRIPATPEVVAAHEALQVASEAVGDQINRLHLDTAEEGLLVLRGLTSVQTDALVAFLRVCAAARHAVKDQGDGQA